MQDSYQDQLKKLVVAIVVYYLDLEQVELAIGLAWMRWQQELVALKLAVGTVVVAAGNLMIGLPIVVLPSIVVTVASYLEGENNSLVVVTIEMRNYDNQAKDFVIYSKTEEYNFQNFGNMEVATDCFVH